ncbi:hypothetical protein [Burkholderia cenocepacia]|uniref:hypothetical protein n=1 Tax=Burkholderia cenocepacia TaxID=95486 RepID=UPI0020B10ED6|nr:hypothetical protein [Burkholderia cenocepacia]
MIKPSVLLRLPGTAVTTTAWDAVAARLNTAATDRAMPVNFTFIFVFMSNLSSVGQPRNSSSDDAWTLSPEGGTNRSRIARYGKALKQVRTDRCNGIPNTA